MSERRCWRTTTELAPTMSLGELDTIMNNLDNQPGMTAMFASKTRTLTLFLEEPSRLAGAPSGTHEFARGWLAHQAAAEASNRLGPLDWSPVQWYDNGRVIPDKSREGFKL